jgi:Trypsin-co-occurring domain 1
VEVTQLVKMDLAEGGSVLVEVAETQTGPVMRGGRAQDLVTDAGGTLESALDQLGPIVKGVVTRLREAADWPDEVTVEFSIKLSADANVIIARTAGEANFRIAMRWSSSEGG